MNAIQVASSKFRCFYHWGLLLTILWLAFTARLIEMRGDNLWFDEAIEFNVANRPIQDVIAADRAMTHDPPLFSLILNLWMQNGRGDFYLQMLPILFSVMAVAVTYVLGRVAFSSGVGLLSALLVAVAPRSVYYGQEVNQYALVSLLAALCPLLLERYIRRPSLGRLLPFVVAVAAAMVTHYALALYSIALALVGTIYLLQYAWKDMRRPLVYWVAGLCVLGLIGLGLLWSYALPQKARLRADFAPVRFGGSISLISELRGWSFQTVEVLRFLFWGPDPTPLQWLTITLLAVGVVIGLRTTPGRRIVAYLITSLIVAYVAAGFGFLVYAHRYMWLAFPLCVLPVCSGILLPGWSWVSRTLRPISMGLAAILIGLLIAQLPVLSGKPFPETELFGDVVRYVEARYLPDDTVYVYYGGRPAFEAYASDQLSKVAVVETWSRGLPAEEQQTGLWTIVGGKPRA